MSKAFTLIEILVVVSIISILSAIILFSIMSYVNKSKDAAVKGHLATLITAGETYYNKNEQSYDGFCDSPDAQKSLSQIPVPAANPDHPYCSDNSEDWAACSAEFVDSVKAFCVDSTGMQEEIDNSLCTVDIIVCP